MQAGLRLCFSHTPKTDFLYQGPNLSKVLVKADFIHRRSYMSAHVLLNLLNKLGERDKV